MKRKAKKIWIATLGGLVLLAGVAMLILPGPAFIVIPAGIAILATEFHWAQRIKERFQDKFAEWKEQRHAKKQWNSQSRHRSQSSGAVPKCAE